MIVPSPPHLQACHIMTCDPTPQTQKSSTTWGPLAAPRTNHGLNPMFDKQTSLMDASCRRGDKQARRPSYNLLGGLSGRAANYLWASSPNRMRAPGTAATYQFLPHSPHRGGEPCSSSHSTTALSKLGMEHAAGACTTAKTTTTWEGQGRAFIAETWRWRRLSGG